MKMRKIFVTLVSLLLCVGITACGKKTVLTLTMEDDPSVITITTDGPGTQDGVLSQDAVTVAEGERIVVTPDFSKGSVTLRISSKDGANTVYDDKVEGTDPLLIEAAPGDYTISVKGTDDGAVGSMTICAQPVK